MATRASAKKNRSNVVIEGDLGLWGSALRCGFLLCWRLAAEGDCQQHKGRQRRGEWKLFLGANGQLGCGEEEATAGGGAPLWGLARVGASRASPDSCGLSASCAVPEA